MTDKESSPDNTQKAFDKAARVLTFAPLTHANLQQAIDIAVKVFGDGDKEAITEEFTASLAPSSGLPFIGPSQFYMVLKNGTPAGVTGYYTILGRPDDIWLNWMGVLPAHRGNGIGRELVQQGFIDMAKPGVKTLRIWTTLEEDYDAARALYKKMGFVEESYKPGAKDAAKLVVVFSKSTNPSADDSYLWKNSAYPIDCESHVIPDLNEKLGLGKKNHKTPKQPKP